MFHDIAIDGPAGAGKSTIAKLVAKAVGSVYVDTGAMYRAIAVHLLREGVSSSDVSAVEKAVSEIDVLIRYVNGEQRVYLNGDDVTGQLRKEEVGNMASKSSAVPAVRAKLLDLQRGLAKTQDVVMDGRDIGTVVLPEAQCKIFLTASVEERARRRFKELAEKGVPADLEKIREDIAQRDLQDSTRATAPLRQAEDAALVDSSDLSISEVTAEILRIFYEKNGIFLAKSAGFCFGVERAVDLVEEKIREKRPIFTLGPIIHNEQVVREFENAGVVTLRDEEALENVSCGTVILRSHGVAKAVYDRLSDMPVAIADATCPFVARIHEIVEKESAAGRRIVIVGDPSHPEVAGTTGWSKTPCIVVSTAEEAEGIPLPPGTPVCVVAQTTFNSQKFKEFVEIIKHKGYDIVILNTICSATEARQEEARSLSSRMDIMLVLGSGDSSNTRKLYGICSDCCANTYYIQALVDLNKVHIQADSCVGITAGASTPNKFIQEVSKECLKSKA